MSKSSATIAIILAAVAGFFVGNITAKRDGGGEVAATDTPTSGAPTDGVRGGDAEEPIFRVPVGNSPSKGPRDALVTIVEVSDFQ